MSSAVLLALVLLAVAVSNVISSKEYSNQWAVEIKGGREVAKRVVEEYGFQLVREIVPLDDHYIVRHEGVSQRSKRSSDYHHDRLARDTRVSWAEQQDIKVREKRDFNDETETSDGDRRFERASDAFNDPQFVQQWYLLNERNMLHNKRDVSTLYAMPWKNVTGKGVVVTILDDGIEWNHKDLADNYDGDASTDLNDNDDDPFPRWEKTNFNKHGTRCAGEVAMVADNQFCGVGVAYNCKIGGVRMLDGKVTDAVEARALGFNTSHIDIFSASWGPSDKGGTVEGPGKLAQQALLNGINKGRGGKGVLYVWASGNGGRYGDSCGCDGYTSSMYTLSISSASQTLTSPWYAEKCASTLATAYSSGNFNEKMIVSSDMRGVCTDRHSGTSAAAPLAAGVLALVLEANPAVTWRDVQHLLALTAHHHALARNPGWYQNGAGFWVNSMFGFGLIDASEMVARARSWVTVPRQLRCEVNTSTPLPQTLSSGSSVSVSINTSLCGNSDDSDIRYLEHAHVVISVKHPQRGRLLINVTSAMGTETTVLPVRPKDKSKDGLDRWPFMSVHSWGEDPIGQWTVTIHDTGSDEGTPSGTPANTSQVTAVSLLLFGTKDKPEYAKPRDTNVVSMEKPQPMKNLGRHFTDAKSPRTHRVRTSASRKRIQHIRRFIDRLRSYKRRNY